MSETRIRVVANGVEQTAARRTPYWYANQAIDVYVNGVAYGLGVASGDGCNCFIDSLRQKLPGVICSVPLVRALLEEPQGSSFPGAAPSGTMRKLPLLNRGTQCGVRRVRFGSVDDD